MDSPSSLSGSPAYLESLMRAGQLTIRTAGVVMPGIGHSMNLERPALYAGYFGSWFGGLQSSRSASFFKRRSE